MLFHVIPIMMKLLGWLPEDNGPSLLAFLILASLLGGMGAVQALVAAGSMIADISDVHEHNSGQRNEGLLFGGLSFAGKAASGLGHIIAGVAIDLIAFPINEKPGEISQDTLTNLALIYGPGVSILGVTALLVFLNYSLPKSHLLAIQDELKLRQQP